MKIDAERRSDKMVLSTGLGQFVPTPLRPLAIADSPVSIAVLIPCFNEALTIGTVVTAFKKALPEATIHVYDNNSTDDTLAAAMTAGAVVRTEIRQGKGNVVRRMFADIEADVFVLADGDGTYEASAAPRLVEKLLLEGLDLVNGARIATGLQAYRPGHQFGNRLLTNIVRMIFGRQFNDMLSGYKVLSRRFVKSFPAMSNGFETETELAVHALELRLACAEVDTAYGERPHGSSSKLRTFSDGARILLLIARLVKEERPIQFFGLIGLLLVGLALGLGLPVVFEFLQTGLVPRLPSAVLSAALVILGVLTLFTGLVLEMITRTRQELKRLIYLSLSKAAPRG
jgi:glycosyltransferase involved in cell wall biosynthesis